MQAAQTLRNHTKRLKHTSNTPGENYFNVKCLFCTDRSHFLTLDELELVCSDHFGDDDDNIFNLPTEIKKK